MDFSVTLDFLIALMKENAYVFGLLGILLLFLLFRRPKIFFFVFFLSLLIAGVLYLISSLSDTGVHQKEKLLYKEPVER
jgi:hypothetical protein